MEKKVITTSINLPVESIDTIIDTDERDVEINILDAIDILNNKQEDERVHSMNTIVRIPDEYVGVKDPKTQLPPLVPAELIDITHDYFIINSIKKRPIEKTNDIKFYNVKMTFSNGIERQFVVPSYVKFYSMHTGTFIAVSSITTRFILMDYTGNPVKTEDAVPVDDFVMKNYYNIKVSYDVNVDDIESTQSGDRAKPGICNFYLNGVLANISYNNFQMKEQNDQIEK